MDNNARIDSHKHLIFVIMKLYKYIILSSVLMMACACVEEEDINPVEPQTGSEVQFGLSLEKGVDTRTVYGPETNTGFPIYWVNGDKVLVASPQCMDGRNSAEYGVTVESATQNYATALTNTGDAGVQWGTSDKADFYSIYPSSGSKLVVTGNTVSATLQVASTQHASTTADANGNYYAQPKEMGNVMMYAYTPQATNGTTVDLKYKPFSTVLEFTLKAPTAAASATQVGNITVQALTLTAPTGTNIAGSFNFNFPTSEEGSVPTIESTTGSNEIVLHFLEDNEYKTVLTQNKTLKAKVCLMPIADVTSMAGWKVTITTSAGTFTKTIADGTGINTALMPGMVHKIVLPTLTYGSKEWEYTLDNWIPTLPDYRNIFLTELSLPGAWYAGSPEAYQATDNIATLWNAGVRAFSVECRSISKNQGLWYSPDYVPIDICISGTGGSPIGVGDAYTDDGSTTYISTLITNILTALSASNTKYPDSREYAVLILSYADGGDSGHRDTDHKFFLKGIAATLNGLTNEQKAMIYSSPITANTTVNDVLGKLIIKINVDKAIPIGDYTSANALISYNPFYNQDGNTSGPYFSDLYWSSWSDNYKKYTSNIGDYSWCFSSANRTQVNTGTNGTIPTYAARQAALKSMMDHSKTIYDASTHNVWFYFNCGGTQATSSTSSSPSPTTFAGTMNKWLLETIKAKTDPSPLGLVIFNQCTGDNATYHGADIIHEIIEMNSKFYLKHAGDDTEATLTSEIQSLSSNYSSAVIDNGTDAMNWE